MPPNLPPAPSGRTLVIGAGKAAASMARAVEDHWQGELSGVVVTRYGHGVACGHIEVVEAAHPLPDTAGQQAARRVLELVRGLTEHDLVLCLISGGGSALLALPAPGLTLEDKQLVNQALLRSGANIGEMNCVRKHLSAIKGGRLAAACAPARVVTLMISDVPGNDPTVIASGPTIADPTSNRDALAILKKYRITKPARVIDYLRTTHEETPKPGDARLTRATAVMLTTPQAALQAAATTAENHGVRPVILGDLEGKAREVALVHAGIARQVAQYGQPASAPCVLISGGETTVTVHGQGRGGRNAEFLLALAVALEGHPDIYALAADTDGIDGTEDNAGGIITPTTLRRARQAGLNAEAELADNNGYGFFKAIDDLILTGPTRTNVNDLRAVLITDAKR